MAEQIAGGLGPNVLTLEGVEPLDEDGDENLVESSSSEAGVHLLIIDLFPTSARDPHGIHAAIWEEVCGEQGFQLPEDKPLSLVSYEVGYEIEAYIEPVAVGQSLADMPLFLRPGRHVSVPLEASYQMAFEGVPLRWQKEL